MKKWMVAAILTLASLPALADDCLVVAHEQRESRCGTGDEACHDRIDRELKRCLARERQEREEARKKPAPHVYVPGLPSTPPPTVMPGWQ